jgi:formate hydrogenlyase transcriptional activator
MDRLVSYPWQGNIRELQNIVERAVVMSQGPQLTIDPEVLGLSDSVPSNRQQPTGDTSGSTLSLQDAERRHIIEALRRTGGVIEGPAGAAQILDLHPNTLRSRMKKLGVTRTAHEMS